MARLDFGVYSSRLVLDPRIAVPGGSIIVSRIEVIGAGDLVNQVEPVIVDNCTRAYVRLGRDSSRLILDLFVAVPTGPIVVRGVEIIGISTLYAMYSLLLYTAKCSAARLCGAPGSTGLRSTGPSCGEGPSSPGAMRQKRWSSSLSSPARAPQPGDLSGGGGNTLPGCNLNRGAPPRLRRCRSFASASSHRTRAWRRRDRDRLSLPSAPPA